MSKTFIEAFFYLFRDIFITNELIWKSVSQVKQKFTFADFLKIEKYVWGKNINTPLQNNAFHPVYFKQTTCNEYFLDCKDISKNILRFQTDYYWDWK